MELEQSDVCQFNSEISMKSFLQYNVMYYYDVPNEEMTCLLDTDALLVL